jgi:hypothetical protein
MHDGSWTMTLTATLGSGESVDMPTPAWPPGADHDKAEINVGGKELTIPDQAEVDFADDHTSATITNNTGEAWPQGTSIYLYVPGLEPTGEKLTELVAQVDQNHEDIVSLDARVSALEGMSKKK